MEKGNYAKDEVAPPQAVLDAIAARLSSHHNALVFVRDHLDGVLGRAFGSAPQTGASASKPCEVRCGVVGAIEEHVDRINDMTSEISSMLARLESLV